MKRMMMISIMQAGKQIYNFILKILNYIWLCPLRTKFNRFYAPKFLMKMKINNSSSSDIDNKHFEIIFSSFQIMNMNVWQCVRQKKKAEATRMLPMRNKKSEWSSTANICRSHRESVESEKNENIKKCARQ